MGRGYPKGGGVSARVWVRVCERASERRFVCVCVCEREREREREREGGREGGRGREREREEETRKATTNLQATTAAAAAAAAARTYSPTRTACLMRKPRPKGSERERERERARARERERVSETWTACLPRPARPNRRTMDGSVFLPTRRGIRGGVRAVVYQGERRRVESSMMAGWKGEVGRLIGRRRSRPGREKTGKRGRERASDSARERDRRKRCVRERGGGTELP